MKIIDGVCKVLISLLLLMPIAGAFGIFPPPTADMYVTPQAFEFISLLMEGKYITYMMAVVFGISFVLLWARRAALTALLLTPITINIVAFHAFLDGGLFTTGAIMGNVLLVLNAYMLWRNRGRYVPLFRV